MEELYRLRDVVEYDLNTSEKLVQIHADGDVERNYYQGKVNGMRYTLRFINSRIDTLKRQEKKEAV